MKPISEFANPNVNVVFTDIDGTLTRDGRLPDDSYQALWRLNQKGFRVVPVTGRPAGWCEMIARFWPVHGVIGENGALYFRFENKKMKRYFAIPARQRKANRQKLKAIRQTVLEKIPGTRVASDQFCRLFDLAIDFAEDTGPLPMDQVRKIQSIFEDAGAVAKISHIHVNGWFGTYDKQTTCRIYCERELSLDAEAAQDTCVFVGDSPNDEPMFAHFTNSMAVANIMDFIKEVRNPPKYVASQKEASGFCEIAERLIAIRK